MKTSTVFYTIFITGLIALIAYGINMFITKTIEQVFPPSTSYRVTCFVQEVLEDGTLSYAREYETAQYPTCASYSDRIIISLANGEKVVYSGPYIIEEISPEQN